MAGRQQRANSISRPQGRGQAAGGRAGSSPRTRAVQGREAYVYGSAVRQPEERPRERGPKEQKLNHAMRKNRDKSRYMNRGYVLFLAAALTLSGVILTGYIGLQSDITNSVKSISRLERQLNDLRQSNDEAYSKITSSIDLEEVKRIAIQELGMKYAEEGQIVTFSGEGDDYVRQLADIPDSK